MKFSSSIVVASLASTSLAAHRGRHARFHAERDFDFELHTKRALEADPTLAKRCGEMINTTYPGSNTPMSFPNCWGACASASECGSGAAASPAAPAAPVDTPAPAAPAPAPAATSAGAANNDVKLNVAVPAASSAVNKAQDTKPSAAPSPSSSSSSGSGSSSSSSSGGMVGLAYNDPSLLKGDWLSGKAAWAYNWGFTSGLKDAGNLEYVPMFHDDSQLSQFKAATFPANVPLLSLNEPDMLPSQGGCNLTPSVACDKHKQAFAGFTSHKISSPSVCSDTSDASKSLNWLLAFHSACSDAKVDFVALHWYGGSGQTAEQQGKAFMDYVANATKIVDTMWKGAPLWFTELAAEPVTDAQLNADFLSYVMKNIAGTRVERIAPFMVGAGGAIGSAAPNTAGRVLLGLPAQS